MRSMSNDVFLAQSITNYQRNLKPCVDFQEDGRLVENSQKNKQYSQLIRFKMA